MTVRVKSAFLLALALMFFCLPTKAEDFLYLDPFLEMRPYEGEVETYTPDYESFFLAAEALADVLHIHIEVNDGEVSGWYFYQTNSISGTLGDSEITLADTTKRMQEKDIIEQDGAYFVRSDVLERWFDIKVLVDVNRLVVNFDTQGRHPFFESIKRKARHRQIDAMKQDLRQVVTKEDEYQWFTWPSTDIRLSHSVADTSTTQLVTASVFDAFQHNVQLLASQRNEDAIYRVKAQRALKWGEQSFHYEFGDIFFPAGKFLRAGLSGRGIAIHGNQLWGQYARNFVVEGMPGWELELYRDDQLIDYSRLDERGQYTFEGVNVNAGLNNYRAVLYGPNGEVEERRFDFNVSSVGVYKGKWLPRFYYIEPGQATMGSDKR